MSDWIFLRQILIRTFKGETIIQPYCSVWWTVDEEYIVIDCQLSLETPNFLQEIQRPCLLLIPMAEIYRITIWIIQGKMEPEKHIILDQNQEPQLKTPIIQS